MKWGSFRAPARSRFALVVAWVLLLGLIMFLLSNQARGENPPSVVQIGLAGSLFHGTPEAMVQTGLPAFRALMKAQTGLESELTTVSDAGDLADRLATGRLQMGVLTGIEFAWAKQVHPNLQPLVVIGNQQQELHAHLFVRQDGPTDAAKLKGRSLVLPTSTPLHCLLFLSHRWGTKGNEARDFFGRIQKSDNAEDALDDVVDGLADATILDGSSVQAYERRKPGRFSRLREVARSDAFPPAVVAYRAGSLDEGTLGRFRTGLLGAGQDPASRALLTLWRIPGFSPVPERFDKTLTAIAQTYPRPRPTVARAE